MSNSDTSPRKGFFPQEHYQATANNAYDLLPFRFMPLDVNRDRYILTNFAGDFIILPKESLYSFILKKLPQYSEIYNELKSNHFLIDDESSVAIDLLATKYRTRQSFLSNFTSLFMFVTTLRCDHVCTYCQVTRQLKDLYQYDMTPEIADRAIEFMFHSPSRAIKVEFQGGESLLNFEIVKYIVLKSKEKNQFEKRLLDFVITTNLAPLKAEHLLFCKEHNINISTSLDGPKELHNHNRPSLLCDSYDAAVSGIQTVISTLGKDKVSALMTTTKESLSYPKEIIDEYIHLGFQSIFLRTINPYGFAVKSGLVNEYSIEEWLDFYKEALSYIIDLNYNQIPFREEYSALILKKMLTPYPIGYVDLQSPAGIGISCLVFNYDGLVYVSDEARMLAQMGDESFCIGNLFTDSYKDIMLSDKLIKPLKETMSEGVPMCADCGIQPYCGSDPVRHYAVQGDMVGNKPTSEFCKKHIGIIRHLIHLLEDDRKAANILRTWI